MKTDLLPDPLPNKPSELLILALKDAEKVSKMPNVTMNMGYWVWSPYYNIKQYYVNLAGAVMLNRLDAMAVCERKRIGHQSVTPEDYHDTVASKLIAIDYFRAGNVLFGLYELAIELPENLPELIHYESSLPDMYRKFEGFSKYNEDFINWISSLIGILQAEGL